MTSILVGPVLGKDDIGVIGHAIVIRSRFVVFTFLRFYAAV